MSRRTGVAFIATGLLTLTAAVVLPAAAQAAADPGSGFGSFSLSAAAPGVQVRVADGDNCAAREAGTAGCEGVIPETVSTLRNGPIGYGLSSVVWPGVLGGNLGSVVLAANPSAPSQVTALNDPVRAESRTGSGPDTVTNSTYPGTVMTATAKDDVVTAKADVAQSAATPAGSFGHSMSATSVKVTGPALAVADASSQVSDISLAGGQLTIGSVTSTVHATTDGAKATAKGKTVVNDVHIAGVPVTIDDQGITVQSQNAPANSVANDAVNTVVSKLSMKVAVSQPSGKPEGGKVVYDAGSLVLNWSPDGAHAFTVVLGGASVSLAALPQGSFDFGGASGSAPAAAGTGASSGGAVLAPASGDTGLATAPLTGVPAAGPDVAGQPQSAVTPALAGQGLQLPGPPSPAYAVIGLLGVGLLLAGMRQLPDRVLEAKARTCPLGETQ